VEILVFHPGGLGDIILSLPALALLRRKYPRAAITIAANLDHLAAVSEGYADHSISLSSVPLHQLYVPERSFSPDMQFWKRYDLVVSWTGFGNSDFVANLRRINPDAIVASWHPGPQDQRHISRLFIESLRVSAEELFDKESKIHLDSDSLRDGIHWLIARGWKEKEDLIAIHPGAGSKWKCWPLERFVEIARRLDFDHYKLLLIEGPAEEGISKRVSEALPEGKAVVAASVPLKLLSAVLKNSRLFIGNDSGLAHLAAALKVPSIVLYGPTLPQHWAPLGSHVTVLHEPLSCRACAAGSGDHTCLFNISVDDVIRAAHRALNTKIHN
jgi:hypothetical protein